MKPQCEQCGLYKGCKSPFLFDKRPRDKNKVPIVNPVMVVGDFPGWFEDEKSKKPFTGDIGNLTKKLLKDAGYNLDNIYFTNAVKCRPPKLNGKIRVEKEQVKLCADAYMLSEINIIKPSLIVAMGGTAVASIYGKNRKISDLRGTVEKLEIADNKYLVGVTYNPASIKNNPNFELTIAQDLNFFKNYDGKVPEINYTVVDSQEKLNEFLIEIVTQDKYSLDIETNDLRQFDRGNKLLCFSISFSDKNYVFAVDHKENTSALLSLRIKEMLNNLLLKDKQIKVIHNVMFDVTFLEFYFTIEIKNFIDTIQLHYLTVTELQGTHGLKDLSNTYTPYQNYDKEIEECFKGVPRTQRDYENVPLQTLMKYNAYDSRVALIIYEKLYPLIEQEDMIFLCHEIAHPALRLLLDMYKNGIKIDMEKIKEIDAQNTKIRVETLNKLREYESVKIVEKLYTQRQEDAINKKLKKKKKVLDLILIGDEKNSVKDNFLRILLFETLGLKSIRKTDTGIDSVDKDSLIELIYQTKNKEAKEILRLLQEVKKVEDDIERFGYDNYKNKVNCDDIWRPSISLHATRTGRTGGEGQQFPKGSSVREIIISRYGNEGGILKFDGSQLELRVMAQYANDSKMIQAFLDKEDIHKIVACEMMGFTSQYYDSLPKKERDEVRRIAKTIDFGVIYGQQAKGLAETLSKALEKDYPVEQAQIEYDKFLRKFPQTFQWIQDQKESAKENLFVVSIFGRKRRLPGLKFDKDRALISEQERQAVNSPIQSTASDWLLYHAAKLNERIKKENLLVHMILPVHDEAVMDYHNRHYQRLVELIAIEFAEELPQITVPIEIEVEAGPNWGETKNIKEIEEKRIEDKKALQNEQNNLDKGLLDYYNSEIVSLDENSILKEMRQICCEWYGEDIEQLFCLLRDYIKGYENNLTDDLHDILYGNCNSVTELIWKINCKLKNKSNLLTTEAQHDENN